MTAALVECTEHISESGLIVAEARLNSAKTLNSLNLAMIRLLHRALHDWAQRADVVAILITGSGDKAFCAGGDIQALYRAMQTNQERCSVVDDYPFQFFEEEYRLDYYIHTYPKPIITLGHGIVMGGGLGVLSASRYRVLTPRSRVALPEITIGLFPDAGASWTLKNMPQHIAVFLGLTGSQINAADALELGIGTHCIEHGDREALSAHLLGLPWIGGNGTGGNGSEGNGSEGNGSEDNGAADNDEMLQRELFTEVALPDLQITEIPQRHIDFEDLDAQVAALTALRGRSEWLSRGVENLLGGCPTTAGIVLEQLRRVRGMELADAFRMELTIATHCAQNVDFAEGVRALLIDKDNAPRWKFDFAGLPREHVMSHFEPPWDAHPLRKLGEKA